MSKYIIGGGISGLIASIYNENHTIITENIGGQFGTSGLGPRILEVNQNSLNFINDLGIKDYKIKSAKIGYKINGILVDNISNQMRLQYYLKSRKIKNCDKVPDSIMSDGKNIIDYYDLNWKEVLQKAKENSNIIDNSKITSIDTKNKIINYLNISDRKKYSVEYEELISTIPAPVFYKLSNLKPKLDFRYSKKYFIVVNSKNIEMGNYDYVYFPETKYDFHRITKINENRASIEYTTNNLSLSMGNFICKIAINIFSIPIGQIISGEVNEIEGVKFLGRFAEWNHSVKIDDVVEKIRK